MALQEYHNTGDNASQVMANSTRWCSQGFQAASAYDISSVKLKLYILGTPGTITVSIRNANSSYVPTGEDLTFGTTNGDNLTTDSGGEWREITFGESYTLTANNKYAIVVRTAWTPPPTGALYWRGNSNENYINGEGFYSFNSGGSWSAVTIDDFMFENYGSTLPGKPTTPNPEDADTEVDFSDFTLSWVTGGNTDSYNVWIGDSENLYLCYEGHTETSYISNWDELITNGDFSSWSFGEPNDWTVDGDFFTDVLQCGDNEGHHKALQADSGLGLCNIYNSHLFGDTVDVYQYVTLEVGKRYALSIEINKVVTGELTIWAGVDGIDLDETVNTAATYSWTFRATSETELIAIKSLAETDITIDNVSVILDEILYDEVIYWEIDAVNEFGTTEGDVWTFDPRPGQVLTFTPLNEATDLTLSEIESTWVSPSDNTDSYNVYFGLESGSLFFVDETVGLLLDLVSVFPYYDYTYYWAIDAVNDFGVTSGNEVSFTTMVFKPPLPTGMNLDGSGTPTGESNMITVRKLVVAANSKIWIEDV